MFYFIISIIILIALLGIFIITVYNRFQLTTIKMDKAENNLDSLFNKRKTLLLRIISEVDDEKTKKMKKDLDFNIMKENHFEAKEKLFTISNELLNYSKVVEHEGLDDIFADIERNDLEIESAISYYNDHVVIYNRLIQCFPSNLIGMVFRYQKKVFYENETKERNDIIVQDQKEKN